MIASAIAAGAAGVVVVFKVGARKTMSAFSSKKRKDDAPSIAEAPATEPPSDAQPL